jgi:hypothetical protein
MRHAKLDWEGLARQMVERREALLTAEGHESLLTAMHPEPPTDETGMLLRGPDVGRYPLRETGSITSRKI